METKSQPTNTQEESKMLFSLSDADLSNIANVMTKEKAHLESVFFNADAKRIGETLEKINGYKTLGAKAKAKRTATAVNANDEVIDALEEFYNAYWADANEDENAGANDLNEAVLRAGRVLKKARQVFK